MMDKQKCFVYKKHHRSFGINIDNNRKETANESDCGDVSIGIIRTQYVSSYKYIFVSVVLLQLVLLLTLVENGMWYSDTAQNLLRNNCR